MYPILRMSFAGLHSIMDGWGPAKSSVHLRLALEDEKNPDGLRSRSGASAKVAVRGKADLQSQDGYLKLKARGIIVLATCFLTLWGRTSYAVCCVLMQVDPYITTPELLAIRLVSLAKASTKVRVESYRPKLRGLLPNRSRNS